METSSQRQASLTDAMLRYVYARTSALTHARRELSIKELDARALLYIGDHPGTRPGTLSDFLGITSAGVTTLIDRLVERGVVRRDVDTRDRRVNRLSVTVDFSVPPWSALTRFDDAFTRAASTGDPDHVVGLASALDALTASAVAAAADAPADAGRIA